MLEQIIQLVTMLFLLSMVCERIADFLKHYLNENNLFKIGDTITKSSLEPKEDARYYRILKINIWCGILTAAILKADLIKILNDVEHAGETIGWDKLNATYYKENWQYALLPLGIALTGCFISFGSKFWHDLLDILLEIKNVKRTLAQTGGQQALAQKQFQELAPQERDDILKSAIHTMSSYWADTFSNYRRVDAGKKIINSKPSDIDCLRFYVDAKTVKTKTGTPVPDFIYYAGFKIPTDVIEDTGTLILNDDWANGGDASTPAVPGRSISRLKNNATGTISLKVSKTVDGIEQFYALSCYHVLFDNEYYNKINEVKSADEAISPKSIRVPGQGVNTSGTKIGAVGWGIIDPWVDAGVALLDDSDLLTPAIDFMDTPKDYYRVITDDENKLKVSFCGARSGLVKDKFIKGCHAEKSLDTPKGTILFKDLIQIEKCSMSGDSGAPVIDQHNRIVGIIEGADDEFTYVIPIQNIINRLKVFPVLK